MLSGIERLNGPAAIIISLAVALFTAFLVTRLTKLARLPNVTGYILAGVLIGPYALGVIPAGIVQGMEFVADIALAFIAFSVGRHMERSALRKNSVSAIVITLTESLCAAAVVALTMLYIFRLPLQFSLLLGAIASATAPASTLMTIRQYRAKGTFVDILLEVVVLDDMVALMAFSVCAAAVQELGGGGTAGRAALLLPLLMTLASVLLGIGMAFILHWMVDRGRSTDNRLILTIAGILALTGVCTAAEISPLLACMAMGTTYVNIGGQQGAFDQLDRFTPPVMALFFVLSGMRLNLTALASAGMIGVVYFIVRIVGKYIGAFAGAACTGAEKRIRNNLGVALIPQAGVSIGLALLSQRMLPQESGELLSAIILSSSVLYEMIGPASAKLALKRAGAITVQKTKPAAQPAQPVENDVRTGL